jgi:hypothetical protein
MTTPISDDQIQQLRHLFQKVKTAVAELDQYFETVTSQKKASRSRTKTTNYDAGLAAEAADVLRHVLGMGRLNRKNLSLHVLKALMRNENRDELKKIILDEDWQDEQDWLTVDKNGRLSIEEHG